VFQGIEQVGAEAGLKMELSEVWAYLGEHLNILYGCRQQGSQAVKASCETFLHGVHKLLQPVVIAWAMWWKSNHPRLVAEDNTGGDRSYCSIFCAISELRPAELQVLQDVALTLPLISLQPRHASQIICADAVWVRYVYSVSICYILAAQQG